MRILITGAGGFLGGEMVRRAAAAGHRVRTMARGPLNGLPASVEQFAFDLEHPGDPAALMQGIEGVIHCAAVTSAGPRYRERSRAVNVEGTRILLEAARRAGAERWVQISTLSAHPRSTSIYGTTKLEGDCLLRGQPVGEPPAWTILRPDLIYGPGEGGLTARLVATARKLPVAPLIGTGRRPLRPVLARDVADFAVRCLESDLAAGKTYVLGGNDEVAQRDFFRRFLAAAGINRPLIPLPLWLCMGLARVCQAVIKIPPLSVDNVLGVREREPVDDSLARQELGWSPAGLTEGLKEAFPRA